MDYINEAEKYIKEKHIHINVAGIITTFALHLQSLDKEEHNPKNPPCDDPTCTICNSNPPQSKEERKPACINGMAGYGVGCLDEKCPRCSQPKEEKCPKRAFPHGEGTCQRISGHEGFCCSHPFGSCGIGENPKMSCNDCKDDIRHLPSSPQLKEEVKHNGLPLCQKCQEFNCQCPVSPQPKEKIGYPKLYYPISEMEQGLYDKLCELIDCLNKSNV